MLLSLLPFCFSGFFFALRVDLLGLAVDWQLDPGCRCFVIGVRVDLSRGFCGFAAPEQGSVHERAVELSAPFCRPIWCFAAFLFFEERVRQYQMVDCQVSEPLSSAVLRTTCVSNVLEVNGRLALRPLPLGR